MAENRGTEEDSTAPVGAAAQLDSLKPVGSEDPAGFGEPVSSSQDHSVSTNDSSALPVGTKLADGQTVSAETSDVGFGDSSLAKDQAASQGAVPSNVKTDPAKPEIELPGQRVNVAAPNSGAVKPAVPNLDAAGTVQPFDNPHDDDPSFHSPAAAQAEYPYNGGSLGAGETAITDAQREAAGQIRMSDHESK